MRRAARTSAVAISGTTTFIGGNFTIAGGVPASNIVAWNGSSWTALGSGMNSNVEALAVSGRRPCGGWTSGWPTGWCVV